MIVHVGNGCLKICQNGRNNFSDNAPIGYRHRSRPNFKIISVKILKAKIRKFKGKNSHSHCTPNCLLAVGSGQNKLVVNIEGGQNKFKFDLAKKASTFGKILAKNMPKNGGQNTKIFSISKIK